MGYHYFSRILMLVIIIFSRIFKLVITIFSRILKLVITILVGFHCSIVF